MYGYICPECGCYLDPGEKCDCKDEEKMREERIAPRLKNCLTLSAPRTTDR